MWSMAEVAISSGYFPFLLLVIDPTEPMTTPPPLQLGVAIWICFGQDEMRGREVCKHQLWNKQICSPGNFGLWEIPVNIFWSLELRRKRIGTSRIAAFCCKKNRETRRDGLQRKPMQTKKQDGDTVKSEGIQSPCASPGSHSSWMKSHCSCAWVLLIESPFSFS